MSAGLVENGVEQPFVLEMRDTTLDGVRAQTSHPCQLLPIWARTKYSALLDPVTCATQTGPNVPGRSSSLVLWFLLRTKSGFARCSSGACRYWGLIVAALKSVLSKILFAAPEADRASELRSPEFLRVFAKLGSNQLRKRRRDPPNLDRRAS